MAPLPSNNTNVLFVDYTGCGESHTTQFRYSSDADVSDALGVAASFFAALGALIREITITGARTRAAGANVTLPVPWTGFATYGVGAGVHNESAYYADFVGRSNLGRRCRVSVFCVTVPADTSNHDFRLSASESEAVSNALEALTAEPLCPVAIDGGTVTFHQYANIGTNAYWRNRIR